jgi:hypothetical protein
MTAGESRQVVDQMDVDAQVVAESSRSCGRGKSAGPGIRHCGVYRKTGHNVRTCQEVIEVTENEDSN